MRYYQVWWNIARQNLMRCCLSDLTRYISSSLMRRRLSNLMRWRLYLMSRFRQDLMSRFCQILIISRKFESNSWNINDEMIKHDHENEFTEIFLQKKNLKSHFSITSHISRQNVKHVISIFTTNRVFRKKHS
jgi:hypothetical protein